MELEIERIEEFEKEIKAGADVRLMVVETPMTHYTNVGFVLTANNGGYVIKYTEEMGNVPNSEDGTNEVKARIAKISTGVIAKGANFQLGGVWKG